jgi:hypothetical protein
MTADHLEPRRWFQFRRRVLFVPLALGIAAVVYFFVWPAIREHRAEENVQEKLTKMKDSLDRCGAQSAVNGESGKANALKDVIMIPTPEIIAIARRHPNGHVYAIEGKFGPSDVPPQAIKGAWKVDGQGNIVGDFIPNPNYRPKSR